MAANPLVAAHEIEQHVEIAVGKKTRRHLDRPGQRSDVVQEKQVVGTHRAAAIDRYRRNGTHPFEQFIQMIVCGAVEDKTHRSLLGIFGQTDDRPAEAPLVEERLGHEQRSPMGLD